MTRAIASATISDGRAFPRKRNASPDVESQEVRIRWRRLTRAETGSRRSGISQARNHRRWLLALSVAAIGACSGPGPRAEGRGTVEWGGEQGQSWEGPCIYSRLTRWAASMPHELRFQPDTGNWTVLIYADRPFPAGKQSLSRDRMTHIVGRVVEDVPVAVPEGEEDLGWRSQHVLGSIEGLVDISRRDDGMFVTLNGEKILRDTVPLHAECQLRTLSIADK